jgi:hypothetical protein
VQCNHWLQYTKPGTYFATHDGDMVSVRVEGNLVYGDMVSVRVAGNLVYGILDGNETEVINDINEAASLLKRYIA